MGELYDAPNQQVVRPDGSAPWEEGEGGSTPAAPEPQRQSAKNDPEAGEKDAKETEAKKGKKG